MIVTSPRLLSLLALVSLVPAALGAPSTYTAKQQRRAELRQRQAEAAQESLTLDPAVIQQGLLNDGQGDNVEVGQVRSLTSANNFINFCLTQNVPLTNGQQIREGSCNPTPIGRIIGTDRMPASKFTFPRNGDTSLVAGQPFTLRMAIRNMQTGNFVNPQTNYYAAPQQVNDQGIVIGHSHVVIEKIPSFNHAQPLDPLDFAFFKGLNFAADGNGELTAEVTNGLTAGFYRMSSINAAANHQPVLVAVAQHGSLDDAVYFEVREAGAPPPDAGAGAPPEAGAGVPPEAGAGVPPEAGAGTPPPDAGAAPPPAAPEDGNLQPFTGSLGEVSAPPITSDGTTFATDGATFNALNAAIERSCNTQRNGCANKANELNGANGVTIQACDAQRTECLNSGAPAADAGGQNLQTFTEALGGVQPIPVFAANGQFLADGATFSQVAQARDRSCQAQRNLCADNANAVNGANGVTIEACDAQRDRCVALVNA